MNMRDYFSTGEVIENFCNGFFGRDDYYRKIAIIVEHDFVVFKYYDDDDGPEYTLLNSSVRLEETLKEQGKSNWSYQENE